MFALFERNYEEMYTMAKGKIVKVERGFLRVVTNNQPRETLQYWQLTDDEKKEVDYRDENDGATFFRYRGNLYDMEIYFHNSGFSTWDATAADSFFSGTCIKLLDGGESVIVGTYYQADSE
jgi:hypothetical protein